MSALAMAGLITTVGFWCLVFGIPFVTNLQARRRGSRHHISWIEFVPFVFVEMIASPLVGWVGLGALHLALIVAGLSYLATRSRRQRAWPRMPRARLLRR